MTHLLLGDTSQINQDTIFSYDFFKDIPEIKKSFIKAATEKTLQKKEYLWHAGDIPHKVYYLIEGTLIINHSSQAGKELIVFVIKPGSLLLYSNVRKPRMNNAQAITSCRLLAVQSYDFNEIMMQYPKEIIELLMDRSYVILSYLSYMYLSAFVDNAETRLKRFLARFFCEQLIESETDISAKYCRVTITQDQLASGIGVSRAMVNKLLHNMEESGLVSISARKIYLINPSKLLHYIEL